MSDSNRTSKCELNDDLARERHYSVSELAELWNLSRQTITKWFQDEPGVLVICNLVTLRKAGPMKRRHTTLRIPESVVVRVHRKLSPKKAW